MGEGRWAQELDRYVPRLLAEWDMDAPASAWRQVDGTLCFLDISGFTRLSERLARKGREGAEELVRVLNDVFGQVLGLAYGRGGQLLKFGGDALLLLFEGPDHPIQACSAAVDVRRIVRAASGSPTSVGRLSLDVAVGLHSGRVDLVRAGSSHRELLVLGPAATVTTEMERIAEAGTIVISRATARLLPDDATLPIGQHAAVLRWRQPRQGSGRASPRRPVSLDTIRAFVPVRLRSHLEQGGAEPEHRTATVAFVRFSGVDALLAQRGGVAAAQVLDSFMTTVQAATEREQVTFLATDIDVDGGKVMLAAGAPAAAEDDAGRLLRTLRTLAEADTELCLQMGANRGHVFAGAVGSEHRATYTVMGDTTNLAARLMAAAPVGSIYAAPAVLEAARTRFATTEVPPLRLKGKSEPQPALTVGAELAPSARAGAAHGPLIGRRDEFEVLSAALNATVAGDGQVVEVLGEAGIGKSRLVDEAIGRTADIDVLVFRGEPSGMSAYGAVQDAIRRALGIEPADRAQLGRSLARRVRRLVPRLAPMVPLIAEAAHVPAATTPEVDALEGRFRRDRLAASVSELLDVVFPGPLVVVAEDAHWLDDGSAHLLAHLASRTPRRPRSVISVRRPGPEEPRLDGSVVVELQPLSPAEVESLVLSVTSDQPIRSHDLIAIAARSGGNPLFALELVSVSGGSEDLDALPASIEAVAAAQVDALTLSARRLLREASVLGTRFPSATLGHVLGLDGPSLDAAVRDLHGFLEPDAPGWVRFRLAVHRDVAYHGLSYARRRQLHRRAAEAIADLAGDDTTAVAHRLARHWALADDHQLAYRFGRQAGDLAAEVYSNEEAAQHYRRALAAARQLPDVERSELVDLLGRLGDVLEHCGRFTEALRAYQQAAGHCRHDAIVSAELWLRRARAHERAGAYRPALVDVARGRRALSAVSRRRGATRLEARLVAFAATIRQAQERPHQARELATAATRLARRGRDRAALARSYLVLGWSGQVLGDRSSSADFEAARQIYVEMGDLIGQATATANLGVAAYFAGRWDHAVTYYGEAQDAFTRAGDEVQAAISAANMGELLVNQRRFAEAGPVLREAQRVLRASGFTDATFAEIHLARMLAAEGRLDDAGALLAATRDELTQLDLRVSALEATIHLSDVHLRRGDPAAALALLDGRDQSSEDATLLSVPLARARARALRALGRFDEASTVLAAAVDEARHQAMPYELALLLDDDGAGAQSAEASELFTSLGVRGLRAGVDVSA